ncbi:carboxypeptidase regulatory-like domain-containing protein [Sorangium sp. So ce136]|uniref:carboxypeptidase regulatory-like domain-containing protein n=1 Tax=Sorangium sp. So ce136 TaxID=3133284 RepID=UPI003F0E7399
MHARDLVSLSALALAALTLGVGCPEEPSRPAGAAATTGTTPAAPGASAEQPGAARQPSQAPQATGQAAAPAAPPTPEGKGTIKGVVKFTGKPVEMKVPTARKDAPFCQDKEVAYNAVIVNDGKLKDTFVRIAVGGVQGSWKAPDTHAVVDQKDCMYEPRIQGVVSDQQVDIKNSDRTLHNVHTYKGSETLFNQAQPRGGDPLTKTWKDGIVKLTCDIHPWMRGFVVVTDHPFFAVSGDDGSFTIEKVPAGKYKLEAWHPRYGLKTAEVSVADDKPAQVTFTYAGTEPEPAENKDELKGLW